MRTSRMIMTAIAATGLAFLLPGLAMADAAEAKATAAQHAGFAAGSEDLSRVRLHLQHTLNCLVGPDADGFDESAGNPCAEAGAAITQTSDAGMRDDLESIAMQVTEAIANEDMAAARAAASEVRDMLSAE